MSTSTVSRSSGSVRPITRAKRWDVSLGGLVREAAFRALEDAEMEWSDIDAVVLGKAPDLFEGIMKPELYLSDALGATGKPMFRVHTAGSVGGTTGIVASHLVAAGRHKRVLAVGYQKQSEGNAQFALGSGQGASMGAGGAFAPYMRGYIHRSGAPEDIGPMVAVKDRQNALKNPYAHLKIENISIEQVKASPMMWDPVRYLESCPSSDGACAVVLHRRGRRQGRRRSRTNAGMGARHCGAFRTLSVPRPRSSAPRRRGRLRHRRVPPGGHHEPARAARLRRALRAIQLVRADVARSAPHRRAKARAGRWSSPATPRWPVRSP
jgi:acetyl-CoA acetyltransferase